MEFGILGPVEVGDHGGQLRIGGAQRVAIVARLLLGRGDQVAVDQLVEDLWPGRTDPAVRATLQSHVSQLRKVMGADRLVGTRWGYALRVDPGELDADRFEIALGTARSAHLAGDVARASASIDAALALWRGRVLADVVEHPWTQAEASRLDELRAEAIELAVQCRLDRGDAAGGVTSAEAAVAEFPFRESLWAQLLLALYRSGRQAEALRAFQRVRHLLADELGIEPSAPLVALEDAILFQKPELDWTPTDPRPALRRRPARATRLARASRGPLVGRGTELAALASALPSVEAGLKIVVLRGEPGVGKTRLAAAAARLANDAGVTVVHGWWIESPPYPRQAFVEIVSALDPGASAKVFASAASTLAPELRSYEIDAAVADVVAEAADRCPVLMVLDDAHWADPSSVAVVDHLVDRLADLPVTLLFTLRPTEAVVAADAMVTALLRDPAALLMDVHGLTVEGVAELAAALTPRHDEVEASLAQRLLARSGGNPLLVCELVRSAGGRLDQLDSGVSTTLRDVVTRQLEQLSATAHDVLAAAAVAGAEFDADVVGLAIGCDDDDLWRAVAHLRAAGLVVEVGGRPGRFSFAHDLVREVLDTELGGGRQPQLHRRLARALEDRGDGAAADLARHWLAAARPDDLWRALDAAARAGEEATAAAAPAEAAAWFQRGVDLLDALPGSDEVRRCDFLIRLGRAQLETGDPAHWTALRDAAALAERIGDAERLAHAALAGFRGMVATVFRVDDERVAVLERAIVALGDAPLRADLQARLFATLAAELMYGDAARRREAADQALARAMSTGNDAVILDVLLRRMDAVWAPDRLPSLLDETAEVVRLAEACGGPAERFWAYEQRMLVLVSFGRLDEADEAMAAYEAIAFRLRQPGLQALVEYQRSWRACLAGDTAAAERHAVQSFHIAQGITRDAFALASAQIFHIRWQQGRLEELVAAGEAIIDDVSTFAAGVSLIFVSAGEAERAEALLADACQSGFGSLALMVDLTNLVLWAETAVRLGYAAAAPPLLERLLPFAHQVAFDGGCVWGSVAHTVGTLLLLADDADAAEPFLAQAMAVHEALGAPFLIARTALALADVITRRNTGDARARSLRRRALAFAGDHGYTELLAEATS